MMTCRCPYCGRNRAGRAGGRSFGQTVVPRYPEGDSATGLDRRKERRLRRRREEAAWRLETLKTE